jgi:hypothetical protein
LSTRLFAKGWHWCIGWRGPNRDDGPAAMMPTVRLVSECPHSQQGLRSERTRGLRRGATRLMMRVHALTRSSGLAAFDAEGLAQEERIGSRRSQYSRLREGTEGTKGPERTVAAPCARSAAGETDGDRNISFVFWLGVLQRRRGVRIRWPVRLSWSPLFVVLWGELNCAPQRHTRSTNLDTPESTGLIAARVRAFDKYPNGQYCMVA